MRAVSVVFFLSGIAALVYQVAWQRILAFGSGVGIYSIAMIVAAFMAGLGLGSLLGGRWSVRFDPRAALRSFAVIEIGIAAFGLVSTWLYYDLLYVRGAWLYGEPWRSGVVHFLSFLVPTFLMGMSLPFLVRATVRDAAGAGRVVGVLYGVNMLGAATGALLAPWVLIRWLGIEGAVQVAAVLNLVAGLAALLLPVAPDGPAVPTEPAGSPAPRRPLLLWGFLYAYSGFCALSLEILWFRVVDVAVKAMAFTFGTVLALYLAGCAIGALAGAVWLRRSSHPLRLFVLLQCAILALAALVPILLVALPGDLPVLRDYLDYWGRTDGFKLGQDWDPGKIFRMYLLLPGLVYLVPTILMGLSFPVLQQAVHDDVATSGRKVGLLQAFNIAGCVAGSLLVGLVLLDRVGTTGTIRALVASGVVLALVAWRLEGGRLLPAAALVLGAGAAAIPSQEEFWMRLHGDLVGLVEEDATGVVTLLSRPGKGRSWELSTNGKGQGALPFFDGHTTMGALPVIVHPDPQDVALIGLGTAGTAWAAAARPQTRNVTVFELYAPQPVLLRRWLEQLENAPLRKIMADPRLTVRAADGRYALEHDNRLYDVIEADPIHPDRAYANNLYSVEFYEQVARRLKPGGFMCGWAPTGRAFAAMTTVFPHVIGLPNRSILLASREPIAIDPVAWQARLADPAVSAYLGPRLVAELDKRLVRMQPHARTGRRDLQPNRDLEPRDEFLTPP